MIFWEGMTEPPEHLTETELIDLMEKHGIGTDASIPTHIESIFKRNFAKLNDARRIVPTPVGIALIDAFNALDEDLAKPQMRSTLEKDLTLIAEGKVKKEEIVEHVLSIYSAKYRYMTEHIETMDTVIASSLHLPIDPNYSRRQYDPTNSQGAGHTRKRPREESRHTEPSNERSKQPRGSDYADRSAGETSNGEFRRCNGLRGSTFSPVSAHTGFGIKARAGQTLGPTTDVSSVDVPSPSRTEGLQRRLECEPSASIGVPFAKELSMEDSEICLADEDEPVESRLFKLATAQTVQTAQELRQSKSKTPQKTFHAQDPISGKRWSAERSRSREPHTGSQPSGNVERTDVTKRPLLSTPAHEPSCYEPCTSSSQRFSRSMEPQQIMREPACQQEPSNLYPPSDRIFSPLSDRLSQTKTEPFPVPLLPAVQVGSKFCPPASRSANERFAPSNAQPSPQQNLYHYVDASSLNNVFGPTRTSSLSPDINAHGINSVTSSPRGSAPPRPVATVAGHVQHQAAPDVSFWSPAEKTWGEPSQLPSIRAGSLPVAPVTSHSGGIKRASSDAPAPSGTNSRKDPTQAVYEFCSKNLTASPDFRIVATDDGFMAHVAVNGSRYGPAVASNKKLAKKAVAVMFLTALGLNV